MRGPCLALDFADALSIGILITFRQAGFDTFFMPAFRDDDTDDFHMPTAISLSLRLPATPYG